LPVIKSEYSTELPEVDCAAQKEIDDMEQAAYEDLHTSLISFYDINVDSVNPPQKRIKRMRSKVHATTLMTDRSIDQSNFVTAYNKLDTTQDKFNSKVKGMPMRKQFSRVSSVPRLPCCKSNQVNPHSSCKKLSSVYDKRGSVPHRRGKS
jgi:hypothetical protein